MDKILNSMLSTKDNPFDPFDDAIPKFVYERNR